MKDPVDPKINKFVDATDSFASEGDDIFFDKIDIINLEGDNIFIDAPDGLRTSIICLILSKITF